MVVELYKIIFIELELLYGEWVLEVQAVPPLLFEPESKEFEDFSSIDFWFYVFVDLLHVPYTPE